ncbi:IclR family transcriptional regulator (plasmid) [Haloferacaceae archaeon DSL9]
MVENAEKQSGRRIRSVQIAISIIEYLQFNGRVGVTKLATELGHSKSTIHSHLQTLEEERYVVHEYDRYRLSLKFLDMARYVRNEVGNYDVIKDEVDSLAEETGEIGQFGIEEHNNVSYLYKAMGHRAVVTASQVGTQQPIYSTSLGKTILAYLPEDRQKEILRSVEFEQITPHTITTQNELREEINRILDRGYGIDDEENIEGLRCIAAPIRDDSVVKGAVSLSGPSSRFTDDRIHGELADYVKRAANVIELNTKFS